MEVIKKIIIDFGINYTKVGFGGESEPIKILKTPSLINLEEFFQEKSDNINILSYLKSSSQKKLEIEELASNIINDTLQLYKSDQKYIYHCYILFDLDLKESFREIFTAFIKYIFESFLRIILLLILLEQLEE